MVEWIIAGVVVVFFLVTMTLAGNVMRQLVIVPGNKDIFGGGLLTLIFYGVLRYGDWNPLNLAMIPTAMLAVFLVRTLRRRRRAHRPADGNGS